METRRTFASAVPTLPSLARPLLLGLLLIAFAIRLHRLGAESLWYDETVSVYLAQQRIPELLAHTARDIHPPGYYLLLHLWLRLTTPSVAYGLEYLSAWPSLWCSMIGLTLLIPLARRFFAIPSAAVITVLIASLQPFQIWYAQETRMYALGALCLLLTLWAALPYLQLPHAPPPRLRHALLYLVAAALGLYTLYYFLFWLATLNLVVMVVLLHRRRWRELRSWLLAQVATLLLWLPWLPIFLRQALDPPVPPWREAWAGLGEFGQALVEALAAQLVGHTPPGQINWPWAILAATALLGCYLYARQHTSASAWHLPLLAIGPAIMLLGITLVGPPIYYIRYLATYAPLFALVATGALLALLTWHRAAALVGLLVLMGVQTGAVWEFWHNPLYAADDHRAAVAALAEQWRPGDVILVNAGWVYPALVVYWPTESSQARAAQPPAIAALPRLMDVTPPSLPHELTTGPLVVRAGSVDGDANLGWGLPESDFFAVPADKTAAQLGLLASNYNRLWHYRLYDTVSDPDALIRNWLQSYATPEQSQFYPGPSSLLLESYRFPASTTSAPATSAAATQPQLHFGDSLMLLQTRAPATITAGNMLYVELTWQATDAVTDTAGLAASLRLYGAAGAVVAQQDRPVSTAHPQVMALPVPAATSPGDYSLALVVYRQNDLAPLPATNMARAEQPSPTPLGNVRVEPAATLSAAK